MTLKLKNLTHVMKKDWKSGSESYLKTVRLCLHIALTAVATVRISRHEKVVNFINLFSIISEVGNSTNTSMKAKLSLFI